MSGPKWIHKAQLIRPINITLEFARQPPGKFKQLPLSLVSSNRGPKSFTETLKANRNQMSDGEDTDSDAPEEFTAEQVRVFNFFTLLVFCCHSPELDRNSSGYVSKEVTIYIKNSSVAGNTARSRDYESSK